MDDTIVKKMVELMKESESLEKHFRELVGNTEREYNTGAYYVAIKADELYRQLKELEKTHPEEHDKAYKIAHPLTQKQKEIIKKYQSMLDEMEAKEVTDEEAEEILNKFYQKFEKEMEEASSNN